MSDISASTAGTPVEDTGFRMTGEDQTYAGWVITVVNASFVGPGGSTFTRDIVRHPGAVAVVPITDHHSVLLVRQYRPAVTRWLLEIPAGTSDIDGEPDEETARRELAEEIGYAAGSLTLLTRCLNTPGFCDEETAIYLASDLTEVPLGRQGIEEEHMTIEDIPLEQFDSMVDQGSIVDAATILGVGLARRRLTELAEPTLGSA